MADQKLTALTGITESEITADDLFYMVQDPDGIPSSKKNPVGALLEGYYKISATVSGSDLTVALTHLDGTDPSATKPLVFKVGDSWQQVVSAISFTKVDGTNWCSAGSSVTAGLDIDFFTYIIQETGASAGTKVGASRIPYATTMADFINTTTSEKYIMGNWVNFNSTDVVTNIGRFRARLSASASFLWSISVGKVINHPCFWTDWLTWTPALSGGGSMTYTSTTVDLAVYRILLNQADYEIKCHGTTGGSASNSLVATLPFAASSGAVGAAQGGHVSDSANRGAIISIGTNGINFSRYDDANFGLGSDRYIASVGKYRIG